MSVVEAKGFAVAFVRARHPDVFRSGEWAKIEGVEAVRAPDDVWRVCFRVKFADGVSDFWPVEDPVAEYEFTSDAEKKYPRAAWVT